MTQNAGLRSGLATAAMKRANLRRVIGAVKLGSTEQLKHSVL
jgi:hypothetical protein